MSCWPTIASIRKPHRRINFFLISHSMTPPPKRHPFLPQFYLSYFTDSKNLLWEFDRETKEYTQKGPRGSGWAKHYYRYKGKDGKMHTDIESGLFNHIETGAKPGIDKIDAGQPISEEEMGMVSLFAAFQHTRVP